MSRFQGFGLKPVSSITDTREFSDPLQEGSFTLTFCVDPGHAATERVNVLAAGMIETWVTGDAEWQMSGGKRGNEPNSPQVIQGMTSAIDTGTVKVVKASTSLCRKIAYFLEAERPTDGQAVLNDSEWLAMAEGCPTAFEQVYSWYANLLSEARGLMGNEWRVSAAATSETPSPSTSDTTPTS